MIGPGAGVRVYLACGATDMRKGIAGLAALAQEELRQNPASGAVFAFRGRRGDRVKLLHWDGQAFCLYYKVLERGRFPWPSRADGTARLTSAQLAMLWEGIDWRRPALTPLPDDPCALKALVLAQREEIARLQTAERAYEALVQALKVRIAKLRKQKFGPSSEKIEREIEQLQLALEDLEVAMAASDSSPQPEPDSSEEAARPQRRRRGKPRVDPATRREREVLDPGECCPQCGGPLRLVGEDVSEILEFVAARLKVVETARLKKSCRCCEKMVQPLAPTRPIRRGMAGPGLLAHILVSKFDDQLPLYRQREILARHGADIPRATLIDWCGQAVAALRPLSELIRSEIMRADRLHADDTPIKVLDPNQRKLGQSRGIKEGRIWVYVRDDRPWAGGDPPGAAYWFSPDRKGIHPQTHLAEFSGILQADAYAGFRELYKADCTGQARVREAACWAHLRRDFHDVWKATDSPIAREALERIGALYDTERMIAGRSADERCAIRQEQSKPLVEAFRVWCEHELARLPGKGIGQGDALCAQPLARVHPVPRGWSGRHRQQRCRARPEACGPWKKEFPVRRLGCRWRDRRRCDDAHRDGETVRPRSAGLPRRRAGPHQRPHRHPARRTAALELDPAQRTSARSRLSPGTDRSLTTGTR